MADIETNISADQKVYEDVVGQLNTKQIAPGEMLPSLRVLAARYHTTVTSIRKAVDRAVNEGLLQKQHGKGIFVADLSGRSRTVMLISQLKGDLFSDFASAFMQRFRDEANCSLLMEPSPETDVEAKLLEAKVRDSLADRGLDAIFYMANGGAKLDFLKKYQKKIRVFRFYMDEKNDKDTGDKVLSDWHAGGRDGILHLHENGCTDVLLITHSLNARNKNNVNKDFLRGCRDGAKSVSVRLTEVHQDVESPEYAKTLTAALLENPEINGVYALGDYYASRAYPVIQQCGRVIGVDIAVLGYYNTSWTEILEPTLSSVDVCPAQIVNELVSVYLGEIPGGSLLTTPSVVCRNSTALLDSVCQR